MVNLSNKSSHEFWHDYHDPMIYRVVTFMESTEDWTIDGEQKLEEMLDKLGETLEDLGRIDLQQEDKFIEILSYLKMARMLHIMQRLDSAYPGAASKLLMYAEQNTLSSEDTAGLFLRRNIVFERLRLLSCVFSPERLSLITKALEEPISE